MKGRTMSLYTFWMLVRSVSTASGIPVHFESLSLSSFDLQTTSTKYNTAKIPATGITERSEYLGLPHLCPTSMPYSATVSSLLMWTQMNKHEHRMHRSQLRFTPNTPRSVKWRAFYLLWTMSLYFFWILWMWFLAVSFLPFTPLQKALERVAALCLQETRIIRPPQQPTMQAG